MPIRAWFPTLIYCEPLQRSGSRFNTELAAKCRGACANMTLRPVMLV